MNHPGDEELRALSLGQLAEAELARVSAHLDACPACCQRIDRLAADDRLVTRLRQGAADWETALVSPARHRAEVRALRDSRAGWSAARAGDPKPAPVILPVPRRVGDYDILGEVGRGGMGVVYEARHQALNRPAAVKMILAGEFASAEQERRFRLEAELAARVRHSNVVQVYEVGTQDGRPFLAMEWVGGGSLAGRLDGIPWPPAEAAALVETLARAVDAAHAEGVVHRDLKPANVLLQIADLRLPIGETRNQSAIANLQSAIPKITDFGLALPAGGGRAETQTGLLVGTPGYMAPEQAAGKRALVGPPTDVYSLGVVLYELLTGRLPFRGDSTLEVLRAVAADEPTRPRRLRPGLPRDLEAVTLHCLEKESGRRYPSALALAEDLRRFREGRPVGARPVGAAARLARVARRHPVITVLLALLVTSLFGGVAGVTWKWLEANAEKQAALYQAYRASLAAAGAALQNQDAADAARHLESAPEVLRGWEWRHLHGRLDDSSAVVPLPAGSGGFLTTTPDRFRVGVLTDAGLHLTDLGGGESKTVPIGPEHRRHVSVTQTRHGLRIAAWVSNTVFDLLDEAGRVLCRVDVPETRGPDRVFASPDGSRLACLTNDGRIVMVFDATSGKRTAVCDGHGDAVLAVAFSPDGARLATGGEDRTVCLWDAATGVRSATCCGHTGKVLDAAFRPDGARLVTAASDGTVRQWDAATGREVESPYERHTAEVFSAAYSLDGQWVASAGGDRTVRVWGARGREDAVVLHGHTGRVTRVAFDPGGGRLASLSYHGGFVFAGDSTVRVWDLDPEATLPFLRGHTRAVYPVAYSPDGRWIASGGWDNAVRLWDATTGEACATLPHPSFVWGLAFAPDGSWLVAGSRLDDRLRVWDVATARVRMELPFPSRNFFSLATSPDGTRVAATGHGPGDSRKACLTVFEIATGRPIFSTEGYCLAYSPDGRWLAALAADERTVLLLHARTHEAVARLGEHENAVSKAAFSPDGRLLASCSRDGTVRLWEIDGGGCRVLRGHTDEVFAVAFHPDGTRLATAGRDGAVWLWDVARGEDVARLPGHKSFVWSLAFSPDGSTLASGSGDGTVGLWDTVPLRDRYRARRETAALRPEADRRVERLWRERGDLAAVVDSLRADRTADESLRHAAYLAVLRRAQQLKAATDDLAAPP